MSGSLDVALNSIPDGLRRPLISEFESLLSEYGARRWETVGLKAGKLCEIVYTILSGYLSGRYAAKPSKPKNMVDACEALQQTSATQFSRSVRIQIPRLLIAIYELRNNRDIGHVGGEVDPNHMDAELFLRAGKWILSELVRVFSSLDVDAAGQLIETVTERTLPLAWQGDGVKRVLNPKLSTRDQTLALIYSSPNGASSKDLASWLGYRNLSRFRISILGKLDKDAFIHFDKQRDFVTSLPPCIRYVESNGLTIVQ
jgi:hypothetical protein